MCARYTLKVTKNDIAAMFPMPSSLDYMPNYNLVPTQEGLVLTADEPDALQPMHFGLVPHWEENTRPKVSRVNAVSEEVLEKKSYAPLIRNHKTCLVLADGFYEWDKRTGVSIPYRFELVDRELFAFAGLWSQWKRGDLVYRSFTIMTCKANEQVSKVHDKKRMPVILTREDEAKWLNKDVPVQELLELCKTYPDDGMRSFRVSPEVNKVTIKVPETGERIHNNFEMLALPLNSQ